MALQASGPISIGNINTEFGFAATTPRSLSQLYRNGGIVGAGAPNVPTSGQISLSQFYGAANQFIYTISSNQANLDLRTGAIAAGWDGNAPLVVTINSGVYVSSSATGTPALTVSGSFPGGVSLTNNGFIVGMGGAGGRGANGTTNAGVAGGAGGLALSVSSAITITNSGTIAGGGGGGGGGGGASAVTTDGKGTYFTFAAGGSGGGGGRSGTTNSAGGAAGSSTSAPYPALAGAAGTSSAAGSGGNQTASSNPYGGAWAYGTSFNPSVYGRRGGNGGGWGAAGEAALVGYITPGSGGTLATVSGGGAGSAGAAVSGNANITWTATGTRLGAIA